MQAQYLLGNEFSCGQPVFIQGPFRTCWKCVSFLPACGWVCHHGNRKQLWRSHVPSGLELNLPISRAQAVYPLTVPPKGHFLMKLGRSPHKCGSQDTAESSLIDDLMLPIPCRSFYMAWKHQVLFLHVFIAVLVDQAWAGPKEKGAEWEGRTWSNAGHSLSCGTRVKL